MTVQSFMKWRAKLLAGKGNKYYPKKLLKNLKRCVKTVKI